MLDHADTYSNAFNKTAYQDLINDKIPEKDMWKYSSFWYKNFDEMAKKTMIRQLISKWGIMSIDMQKAFEADMGEIKENGQVEYIDNEQIVPNDVQEADVQDESQEETKDESQKESKDESQKETQKVSLNEL